MESLSENRADDILLIFDIVPAMAKVAEILATKRSLFLPVYNFIKRQSFFSTRIIFPVLRGFRSR
jgi:hypothetical protein